MKQPYQMNGNQQEYRNMLVDLCDLDSGLTGWEVDFVESLSHQGGTLKPGQVSKLEELWKRHC